MRILVTGGAGFIGSHVVEYFQSASQVRVLDDLSTGQRRNLAGMACEFIEGSTLDRRVVDRAMDGVDYVFHLAALVSVAESMRQPQKCVALNVEGLLNVLDSSVSAKVKKLVLASSAAVYGDNSNVPVVETMLPNPQSPYAVTKLDGEHYCQIWHRETPLKTACLRFFNVFGPRQNPNSAYAAAIPIFIQNARNGAPLIIYGDGKQTRDFVYVKDVVAGLAHAVQIEDLAGPHNIGYGRSISIKRLAEKIVCATGSESEIKFAASRPGDVQHSCADIAKILATGWRPSFTFGQGLEATLSELY